jgi:hypothetical protein
MLAYIYLWVKLWTKFACLWAYYWYYFLININYLLFNFPLLWNSFRNPSNDFWTISELFLLSSINTLMFPNITKTILKHHWSLKHVTVWAHSRHYWDPSPVNDHQGTWRAIMIPAHFTKIFCHWTIKVDVLSLCFFDTSNVQDLIVSITIPRLILLRHLLINSFPWYSIPVI